MTGKSFLFDPQPELSTCFSSRKNMSDLLSGLADEADSNELLGDKPDLSWRSQTLFRTCLVSMKNSKSFGSMMAMEVDQRGFYAADGRAFLGDELPYNWTIQRDHFQHSLPYAVLFILLSGCTKCQNPCMTMRTKFGVNVLIGCKNVGKEMLMRWSISFKLNNSHWESRLTMLWIMTPASSCRKRMPI